MLNFYDPRRVCLRGGPNGREWRQRVNLLDFSKFGGVGGLERVRGVNTERLRTPFFADVRYVWNTTIPHKYTPIREEVLAAPRVKSTIAQLAASGRGTLEAIEREARGFLDAIRASISRTFCRFLGWAMFKILRRLTSRLLVAPEQLERVKRADESGIPIVYLPLHKSHLDYVLMHWVLWHFGIRLPHVAAGDNLNMSGFGWCLRWIGAFFIKRHLSPNDGATKDLLYRAVLNQYLLSILKAGMSIEMFVEGTRSRFGKALIPKNGLISVIADAFKSGELPDCYLVPVSFTYDRVPEGIFHEELMGVRKPTESLLKVIVGAFRCVRARFVCGTVAVTFLSPVLLSEELKKLKDIASTLPSLNYASNQNSYRELLPWVEHSLKHRNEIRAIGHEVVFRANDEKPVGVTALLAQLFLCKYRTPSIPLKRVAVDLRALAAEVERLNHEVLGWSDEQAGVEDVIRDCLPYLEGALEIVEGERQEKEALVRMADERKAFITLAYHKNTALSPFRLISLAAIVTNLPQKNGTVVNPTKQMSVLCSFLRYELLTCPPTEKLEDHLERAVAFFAPTAAEKPAFDARFYAAFTAPFFESLLYTAGHVLEHAREHDGQSDLQFIRSLVCRMAADPTLRFAEAANSDSVYNALKSLRTWGALNETRVEVISEYVLRQVIAQLEWFLSYTTAPK